MIEDTVELLDRAWSFLDSQPSFEFVAHVFDFFDGLQRDPRTKAILDDLQREERESVSEVQQAVATAKTALLRILDELELNHGESFPEPDQVFDCSAQGLRRKLDLVVIDDGEDDEDVRVSEFQTGKRVNQVVEVLLRQVGGSSLEQLQGSLETVKRQLEHAQRRRRLAWVAGAGASLAQMRERLTDLHPGPEKPTWKSEISQFARLRRSALGNIQAAVFEGGGVTDDDDTDPRTSALLQDFRHDTRRVYEEVRRRLGAERSVRQLFERYRQRCQWYEASNLRALVKGKRAIEDRLTETLALHLFDHGLNPLVRPLIGRLLPDLLDATSKFSFYVEAKQYSNASRRAYLRQGARQVWDMLGQLRGTPFEVREAFYVVFRLGGPRYAFPERVPHDGFVVFPILIDIAPSSVRGSRSRETTVIHPDELLPRDHGKAQRRRAPK